MSSPVSRRSMRPLRIAAVAVLGAGFVSSAAGQVHFELVPHGLDFENADVIYGGGLSADGSVMAIGYRDFFGWVTTYRYQHPGVVTPLPHGCAEFPDTQFAAISGDGNTFGGVMWDCARGNGAAYWNAEDGLVFLGSFPNGVDWINGDPSSVAAISEDGSVIVGTANGATDPSDIEGTFYVHAFRVVRPSTTLEDLGVMPGSDGSRAMGISADGAKILVRGEVPTYNEDGWITNIKHVASIWTEAAGHQVLPPIDGVPPEYNGGFIPGGISPDGGTVVGSAAKHAWAPNNPGYPRGYKWSAETGYTHIPAREDLNLPVCRPTRASTGGTVVAGSLSPPNNIGTHPFLWDAQNGTRLISEIVAGAGYDVQGWNFTSATISADGRIVTGNVIRPHPDLGIVFDVYRLELGAACPADWNDDGENNSSDISAFLTSWLTSVQNGDLTADFNADGTTNSSDISAFLTAWLDAVTNGC